MADSVTTPGDDPGTPLPRRRRRLVRGFVWLVAVLGLLVALAYTSAVQRWAFDTLSARLARSGTVLRANRVSLNPLSLGVSLDGVTIASAATPAIPYLTAAHVDLVFATSILRGTPIIERIRIVNAVVDMEKVAPGKPGGEPFRGLRSLKAGDVTIENFSFLLGGPDEARMALRKLSVHGVGDAPGRIRFETISPATLLIEIADAKIPFDTVTGTFTMDGDRVNIARLTGHSDTAHVEMRGFARFDHGYPLQVDYEASVDVPKSSAWWAMTSTLKGRAALTGHITGPLASPVATATADVPGFAWLSLSPGRLSATGAISLPGVRLDTFALAVPEMTARGDGFLSWADITRPNPPRSTINARWHAPLLRKIGPLVELDPADIPLVAADGTAKVNWPGFVPDLGRLAGTLRTTLTSGHPDHDDHGIVDLAGADAKWHMDFEEHLPGDTVARGSADVRINALEFGRSTMTGTMDASIGDAAPMLKRAAALDIPVPETALTDLEHGKAQLSGPLSGTVAMPKWHASLDATDVVLSGLHGITVGGAFTVDPDVFITDELDVRAPGTKVRLHGNIGVLLDTSDLRFEGDVDAAWASAPFVPAEWPLAGRVPITGRWVTDVDRDDLEVAFDAPAGTLAGKPVGPVRGKVLSGLKAITGDVTLPELGGRLSGTYDLTEALAHSGRAEFVQANLTRWLAIAGTAPEALDGVALTFDGTADASGTFETIDASRITATITRLSGDVHGRPVLLEAPAVVRWDHGTLDAGEAAITAGGARLSVAPAADALGTSAITMTSSLADVIALLPAGSMPPGLTADGSLRIDARLTHRDPYNPTVMVVADATSVLQNAAQVARDLYAEAVLSGDRLDVPSLKGVVMGANVNATASAPARWVAPWVMESPRASGPKGARLTGVIDAPLPAVATAAGYATTELGGAASVAVDIAADAPSLDSLRGTLDLVALSIETKTGTFTADGPGRIRLAGGRAEIETLAVKGPQSRLEASGGFALAPDGAVDVRLAGTASMAIIDALVAPRVSGAADIELRVAGTVAKPDLDGSVTLRDVSALTPDARLMLARFGGRINFTPGHVQVVGVEGQLNGGTLTLSGEVPLSGPPAGHELRLNARDVFVEYPSGLRSRLSVDLTFSGGLETPELRGTTTFQADPYRETLPQMAQLLTAVGQTTVAAAGEEPGLIDRIALNVKLKAPMPLRLDNSLGKVEVVPDLRIVGTVAEPAIVGPVDILDGSRIYLQSRTYTLTDSRMEFSAEDGFIPRLQVVGSTKVGEYDVTLRIDGPADAMEMNLSSVPPLPERDLRALLLTGQTEDASGTAGSSAFALTALSSDLLGMAGQALGLDNVRIGSESFELVSSDVNPTTRLTLSKLFLNDFELIYSDNLEKDSATWILIYRPRSNIELRASSRDNLDRVAEFRQSLAFGPGGSATRGAATVRPNAPREAPREVVASVDITGEPPQTVLRLRPLLKLKPGGEFSYTDWRGDHDRIRRFLIDASYLTARVLPIRQIIETGDASKPSVALGYEVTRGPLTIVTVTGFPADDRFVARIRQAWALTTFEEFAAADMSRAARLLLLDRGYVQPEITTTIAESGPGRLLATVDIRAGVKPSKRSVEFDGMSAMSELDLVALAVATGTKDTVWHDPGALCHVIQQAYAARGYRHAQAKAQPIRVTGDSAVLPIWIDEGAPTRVGAVEIAGAPAALAEAATAALALTPGKPLPAGEERAARLRVEQHFRNLGYRNATVGLQVGRPGADGQVALRFPVTTGRRQVIQAVKVEGAVTTRPSVIQRALRLSPGDPAGQAAITAAQRRLYQVGVFSTANIRLVPAPSPAGSSPAADTVPVTAIVSLAEPRKYQFVYGIEASNAYGPIFQNFENTLGVAADVRDRNLFGRGLTASAGARYEANIRSARTLFSAPTLWAKRIRTNLYLSWRSETLSDPGGSAVDFVTKNATIEQRWRPRSWMDLTWGYTISDRRYDGVLVEDREVSDVSVGGVLASLNGTVVIDRRNSALDASRGWFHASSLQEGTKLLASDFRYTRYLGRAYFYFSPMDRLVVATAARAGVIWNIGGTATLDVVDLLFKAGGSQTVRGYRQDQLIATTVDGLPFGGTRLLVLNEELRFRFSKLFQGVVFADAGNTFLSDQFAWRDLAVGLGFGVRINTPIAPLRFDIGFPVPRRPGDRLYRLYVSVGQMF
jgi:outer membrane protein assembly factor BamA/autotransporter translocation and assembly factor TamB